MQQNEGDLIGKIISGHFSGCRRKPLSPRPEIERGDAGSEVAVTRKQDKDSARRRMPYLSRKKRGFGRLSGVCVLLKALVPDGQAHIGSHMLRKVR